MLTDASIYDDNMTLLQAYKALEKRVKALEAGGSYTLPTASATVKGGVRIGSGLQMNGEVLSATGGGGGGSTSFRWDTATTQGDVDGLANPPEGFMLGWGDMLSLPLKGEHEETITIVATNVEDETDTKTFYLPNSSLPSISTIGYNNFSFSNGNEPLNLIPLTTIERYGNKYISTPSFQNRYFLYSDSVGFPLYESEDQSGESGDVRYYATPISREVTPIGYVSLTIGGLFPSLYPTLNGTITELNIVDQTDEKTYHWEGTIPYSEVFEAGPYEAWQFYYSYLKAQ